jgi:hypothetical protein
MLIKYTHYYAQPYNINKVYKINTIKIKIINIKNPQNIYFT